MFRGMATAPRCRSRLGAHRSQSRSCHRVSASLAWRCVRAPSSWLIQGEDNRYEFLIPVEENGPMLSSAIAETTAPCPKCRADMVLAVITPHPIAPQLGKHTYLCTRCNQTKTYILPTSRSAETEVDHSNPPDNTGALDNRRRDPRETLAATGTPY